MCKIARIREMVVWKEQALGGEADFILERHAGIHGG